MNNFYKTLIIIAASGILLVIYYIIKQMLEKYRIRRRHVKIWNKLYADERRLIESRLRNAFGQLERQQIQWILCHSRNRPELKIQFIYSALEKQIHMDVSGENMNTILEKNIQDIGGVRNRKDQGKFALLLPVNAKIATDLIFLLFKQVAGQKKVLNLSVKTSGV